MAFFLVCQLVRSAFSIFNSSVMPSTSATSYITFDCVLAIKIMKLQVTSNIDFHTGTTRPRLPKCTLYIRRVITGFQDLSSFVEILANCGMGRSHLISLSTSLFFVSSKKEKTTIWCAILVHFFRQLFWNSLNYAFARAQWTLHYINSLCSFFPLATIIYIHPSVVARLAMPLGRVLKTLPASILIKLQAQTKDDKRRANFISLTRAACHPLC